MKHIFGNTEELLHYHISGFHQYCLQKPYHLIYASKNFCQMLDCTEEELINETSDLYIKLIHPADRKAYGDFLERLALKEGTESLQYRIVKKDGETFYVKDICVSQRLEDGTIVGYSTLTDITQIKTENSNLRFLSETMPCGFLRYTCTKTPKITYLNEQMKAIMRFPKVRDGELDYLELYKENIYLVVPIEERRRFAHFLERAYLENAPLAGEMTVLRCDGTKARLYGWVTKCISADGTEEFQSICMDITDRYQAIKHSESERYLKALEEVYDKIFEYDFSNQTVKYLYGHNSESFKWLGNVPMQLEDATERWIERSVLEKDKERLKVFINRYLREPISAENRLPQIQFQAYTSNQTLKSYIGVFLKIDASISFFCCRSMVEAQETDTLRNENISLRNINENMQEFVMRFTDGIAAFEVRDNMVTPLYASDNICEFFGFSKDEWISMMRKSNDIRELVSRSGVDYEEFVELLTTGEAEFSYFDISTNSRRRIKAICSQKVSDGTSPRYVMLYNINQETASSEDKSVYIRTFGYFDVFIEEKPIAFRNKKSKELFALLVDRRGGYVSSEEAISFLWEDEPVSAVTLARYRKVALRLKNILEEYGIADIVESVDGKRRIVADKVRCDLYDYLSGKEEYAGLFKGSYLSNYSWGENTLSGLLQEFGLE